MRPARGHLVSQCKAANSSTRFNTFPLPLWIGFGIQLALTWTRSRKHVTKEVSIMKNIVLVHGGFVDGAGWEGVYKILKKDGYNVTIVQNPTISLEDDVAATKRILAGQDGPTILVGHSYGGAVITEAGNDPKVAGLVYITAFAPDKGES